MRKKTKKKVRVSRARGQGGAWHGYIHLQASGTRGKVSFRELAARYNALPADHPDRLAAVKMGQWAIGARKRLGPMHRPFGVKTSVARSKKVIALRKASLMRAGVLEPSDEPFVGGCGLARLRVQNADSMEERLAIASTAAKCATARDGARGEAAVESV